jgi:hypothetical protein
MNAKHGKTTTNKQQKGATLHRKRTSYDKPFTLPDDNSWGARSFFLIYPELRAREDWYLWLASDIPGFSRMSIDQRRAAAFALVGGEPLPDTRQAVVMEVAPRRVAPPKRKAA